MIWSERTVLDTFLSFLANDEQQDFKFIHRFQDHILCQVEISYKKRKEITLDFSLLRLPFPAAKGGEKKTNDTLDVTDLSSSSSGWPYKMHTWRSSSITSETQIDTETDRDREEMHPTITFETGIMSNSGKQEKKRRDWRTDSVRTDSLGRESRFVIVCFTISIPFLLLFQRYEDWRWRLQRKRIQA